MIGLPTHRLRAGIAAALAAAGLLAGSAGPAAAAQGFTLSTPKSSSADGSTYAIGSVSFSGPRTFAINSTVNDFCPADGRGAYLVTNVFFMDGTGIRYGYAQAVNRDTDGCGNGSSTNTATRTYSKRVKRISVHLVEVSAGGSPYQWDSSSFFDNRFT